MRNKGSMKICPYCEWEETTSPESPRHLPPRTVLSNQYLIGRVISEGKFSLTYLGYDFNTNQKIAIKEYLPEDIARRADDKLHIAATNIKHGNDFNFGLGKFIEESMALESQKHLPGLAHTTAIFRENGTAYRVMDYIEGPNCEEYLETKGGSITFHQLVRLITPVMIGLERVYESHLLHYDICPENIIVGKDGIGSLVDFTATRFELSKSWKNIASVSRPGYSPIEFYKNNFETGPWSDVYSLAATIYHALTGEIPPEAPQRRETDSLVPPSELDADISAETEAVLLKALAVKPEDRYQSVKAFKESILESWYTRERKKPSIALDVFTRARCPYCGTINEVLKTDLETGTAACFACHHPLVTEDGKKLTGISATEEKTPEAPPKRAPRKKSKKPRYKPARPAFTQVTCSDCGTATEVLISDLGTLALCTKCGAHLPAEPDISPPGKISTEEAPVAEIEETPLFSTEETPVEEIAPEEIQSAEKPAFTIAEEAAETDDIDTIDFDDSNAIEEERELEETLDDEPPLPPVKDVQKAAAEDILSFKDEFSEEPETDITSAAEKETTPEILEKESKTADEEITSDENEGESNLAAIKAILDREEDQLITEDEEETPPAEHEAEISVGDISEEIFVEETEKEPEDVVTEPSEKDLLTPLDCPVCQTRNYFSIEEILSGVQCQKCAHRFFTEAPGKKVKEDPRYPRRERLARRRIMERKQIRIWIISLIGVLFVFGVVSIFWFQGDDSSNQETFENYLSAGDRHFKEENYPSAITSYQSALDYKPGDLYLQAQIRLSDSLLAEQQKKEAEKRQQDLLTVQLFQADSLFAIGKFSEAKLAYEAALIISPDDLYIFNRLSEIEKMLNAPPPGRVTPKVADRVTVRPQENLQQRIDRAAANSIVHLQSGIYKISKPLSIQKPIELKGAGPNHTLIVSNTGESVLEINNITNLKVSGVGFEYQGEKWSDLIRVKDSKITINNCLFRGAAYQDQSRKGGNGILFEGSSTGRVQNSRFHNNYIGINIRQKSKPTVSGNEIWNNHVGVQISETARPALTGNRIRENFNNGIAILDQAQPVIESNQINENRANGLFFYGSKFSGNIRNNQIFRNRDMGILLANESQPTVEGNKIKWNGLGGLQFNDKSSGIVRDNEIQNNKHGGIKITNTAKPMVKTNSIKGNQGDGIEIMDRAAPTVDGNEITQNNGDGISLLLTAPGGFVSNNICKGNQGYGISILKSARPSLVNNKLQGNFEGNMYDEVPVEIQ
jgi:parallel beta-helix repeat protein